MGDGVGSDFEPAVLLANGPGPLDLAGMCYVEIAFHVGVERRLVVLDGRIVSFGIENALGDGRIASMASIDTRAPLR
jgi:hypothetical protein